MQDFRELLGPDLLYRDRSLARGGERFEDLLLLSEALGPVQQLPRLPGDVGLGVLGGEAGPAV